MVGVLVAVVAAGILISLALGVDLKDLPWFAIIVTLVLGSFFLIVQRRRRRALEDMDDSEAPSEQ